MKNYSIALFIVIGILFSAQSKWYLKNKKVEIDDRITSDLERLGDSAINTIDVPVAAVLIYDNNIIGEGYNTVRRNKLAGGHAEINAITDAIRKVGLDSFAHFDRKSLALISTWEPCLMCRGAIIEYNIRNVVMVTPKSLGYNFWEWKKAVLYEWTLHAANTDTLQYYLFKKYTEYHNKRG